MMILAALAALALASSAPPSFAQKVDKNGRCHDASGKFAKADVCKGGVTGAVAGAENKASGAAAAAGGAAAGAEKKGESAVKGASAAVDANGPYKLDSKGKCHDAKGKMASKAKCA
jgi:hypothetical protein